MDAGLAGMLEKGNDVDPFLIEALQNQRHRLTILRMEIDIQKFLQNPSWQQFEFQHFSTSYLRLAAHRVAQHYALETTVQDNGVDGLMNKILAKRTTATRYPSILLSEVPVKQLEGSKPEHIKIATRPQANKGLSPFLSSGDTGKENHMRTVEERMEEYGKARARIFSGSSSPCSDNEASSHFITDTKDPTSRKEETEACFRESTSRVAIFRDLEKDRADPDYDRSYTKYVRNLPITQGSMPLGCTHNFQHPFVGCGAASLQPSLIPRTQPSASYGVPASSILSSFYSMQSNQMSVSSSPYLQWPTSAVAYPHPYEQFKHAVFQAPFCQLPLSLDYA